MMANGERELQIQYNAAYTAGSFFLPICVLSIAFYLFGLDEDVKVIRIIIAGVLTGSAVCGMHYLGQGGISNYNACYKWGYVLGSSFIAVSASTIALWIFFHLKATWTNSWWKRALCASVLAASVSGMHWVATVGTVYRYARKARRGDGLTRQATVVVVLCFVSLFDRFRNSALTVPIRLLDVASYSSPLPSLVSESRPVLPTTLNRSYSRQSSLTKKAG